MATHHPEKLTPESEIDHLFIHKSSYIIKSHNFISYIPLPFHHNVNCVQDPNYPTPNLTANYIRKVGAIN